MSTLFTKIVQGEIPCHKLKEDERYLSFLDVRPIAEGHALVIPKKEVDYIFDLEPELLSGLLVFAEPVARALEKVVPCARIGLMVAGLEVPHCHLHLVPMNSIHDLSFAKAQSAENEHLASLAEKIRGELAG